jgi:parallel beta-helix repeat protein
MKNNLTENKGFNNIKGVILWSLTNNTFTMNSIENNTQYGFDLKSNSENNTFIENSARNNGLKNYNNNTTSMINILQNNLFEDNIQIPSIPENLTAMAGNDGLHLQWNSINDTTIIGYNVYRSSTSNGPYTKIGSTPNLTYTDETASEGETYYYIVRSFSNNEEIPNLMEVAINFHSSDNTSTTNNTTTTTGLSSTNNSNTAGSIISATTKVNKNSSVVSFTAISIITIIGLLYIARKRMKKELFKQKENRKKKFL